jgi:hypothetical protein
MVHSTGSQKSNLGQIVSELHYECPTKYAGFPLAHAEVRRTEKFFRLIISKYGMTQRKRNM